MPAEYSIDKEKKLVLSRVWGCLTDNDLIEHQRKLRADTHFQPDFNQLFDLQEVSKCEVTSEGVRYLADRNPFGEGSRRAFVVLKPEAYGMARMFQALTDEHPDVLRVQYDNLEEAKQWLGL